MRSLIFRATRPPLRPLGDAHEALGVRRNSFVSTPLRPSLPFYANQSRNFATVKEEKPSRKPRKASVEPLEKKEDEKKQKKVRSTKAEKPVKSALESASAKPEKAAKVKKTSKKENITLQSEGAKAPTTRRAMKKTNKDGLVELPLEPGITRIDHLFDDAPAPGEEDVREYKISPKPTFAAAESIDDVEFSDKNTRKVLQDKTPGKYEQLKNFVSGFRHAPRAMLAKELVKNGISPDNAAKYCAKLQERGLDTSDKADAFLRRMKPRYPRIS